MNRRNKVFLASVLFSTVFSVGLTTVAAKAAGKYANWPEETVRLCVPLSAGGNVDNYARIDAEFFSKTAGKPMIVENLKTGGGILCYETVRNAKPDGYTLMIYNSSLFSSYYTGSYGYSPIDYFTPICTLQNKGGSAIIVRADSKWQTLDDLVKTAREKPGTIKFGMHRQSAAEFIVKLLEKDGNCKFKVVDAGSNNDRVTAMLGGLIDVTTNSISSAMQYVKKGDFRILCTTDTQQSPYAPGVKTAIEQGYPSVIYSSQTVLYGPAGMDPELVERISAIFSQLEKDETAFGKSQKAAAPINFKNVTDTIAEVQSQNALMKSVADMLGYQYKK